MAASLLPLVGVVVAVEDDLLVLLDDLGQEVLDRGLELLAALEALLELGRAVVEGFGDRDVERHVRERDALIGRDRAELELVAGEGERAGAVAVARVARELRQHAHADVEDPAGLGALRAARLLDLLEDVGQHVAEEDRDDRRRRFVGAEAVVVASAGDAVAEQALELVDGADHRGAEDQELHVVVRRLARVEEVVPEVVAHAPVEVFARAVDPGKWLLVQQARETVLRRDPSHHLHRHHLMVGGDVGVLEDRRDFVLARGDLVVTGLDRDADLVELALDVHHEREDAVGDGPEVLILELLALGGLGAEERPAGVDEIRAVEEELPVDEEVLLLGPAGRHDPVGLRAEQLQDADGLLRERLHRAEERRLLVERLTGPADERRRNDERRAVRHHEQPGRAGRIPRRVAARLEG